MADQTENPQKTENNTPRHEVPELPLLRNCLFPEQFSDVPFRFRYQPPEEHDVTTGSHMVSTTGNQVHQGHYINTAQMGAVSDVTTDVHDVIVTSRGSTTNEGEALLTHDMQARDQPEMELPSSGSSLDHMRHLGSSASEHTRAQLDSITSSSSTSSTLTSDGSQPSPVGSEQILDPSTGVLQDQNRNNLDCSISIDSPQAPSPQCLDDLASSRMDRQTPDMSLSSSLSANLNSSVGSSPLTPLNVQDCSGMTTPEVSTPVSSASYLHDDSGMDDSGVGHSSGQKCTSSLLETSCQEDVMSTRPAEESHHMPYRTLDYSFMGMYPTTPYSQTYTMDPTFSQRFAYPREMRTEHIFTQSHSMMETHDDSGIDTTPRSASYYNFQPMTPISPNNNLANWLTRSNQVPHMSTRGQRLDDPMPPIVQRNTQSSADSSADVACEKPPDTYISLISQAILSSPEQRLILSEIYKYIRNTHPYYKTADDTWKNAIRHNLSVNECFVKNGRAPNGRGYYWSIHPACVRSFMEGDFRRREARRLARDANKTREGQYHKQAARVAEGSSTPRRGRSMSLAKVMGLPAPSPMMPASPALIPITSGSYYPSHVTSSPGSSSSSLPPPPPLSYSHPYLSAYYSTPSTYSLPYPPLPSPISNPQGSYTHMSTHMSPHVNPASFSLAIPTIYGNLASSNNSSNNPNKSDYQS